MVGARFFLSRSRIMYVCCAECFRVLWLLCVFGFWPFSTRRKQRLLKTATGRTRAAKAFRFFVVGLVSILFSKAREHISHILMTHTHTHVWCRVVKSFCCSVWRLDWIRRKTLTKNRLELIYIYERWRDDNDGTQGEINKTQVVRRHITHRAICSFWLLSATRLLWSSCVSCLCEIRDQRRVFIYDLIRTDDKRLK